MNKKMTSLSAIGGGLLQYRASVAPVDGDELQRGCNGRVVKRSGRREV